MKSIFFLLFICLPAFGFSQTQDLTGTVWFIEASRSDIESSYVEFHSNGTFSDSGVTPDIEGEGAYTWSQKGKKVTLRYNNSYSVHKGKITGNVIKGKTTNKAGEKWTWTATQTVDGGK
jgi:hypothetical protein